MRIQTANLGVTKLLRANIYVAAKRSFMKRYLVNWNQHNGYFICAREKTTV